MCYNDVIATSVKQTRPNQTDSSPGSSLPVILISTSETDVIKSALKRDFKIKHVAGAGYKLLGLCQGHADGYVLTKNGTFKWDSCAPHAILRALGGSIVKYDVLQSKVSPDREEMDLNGLHQVKYNIPDDPENTGVNKWCNSGGIVAFKSLELLRKLLVSLAGV